MVGGNSWGMFNILVSYPVSMSVIATDEEEVGNQHPGSYSYGVGGACRMFLGRCRRVNTKDKLPLVKKIGFRGWEYCIGARS